MTMKKYKRQYRELDDDVKRKISSQMKNRKKSWSHRQHIQQSMLKYWKTVPHRPDNNGTQTLNDEEK